MASITLAEIRLQSRQRCDMVSNFVVSETELTSYVNSSLAELHDLLIAAYNDDYYMNEAFFTCNGTDMSYPLPDGTNLPDPDTSDIPPAMYKLRGVDSKIDNQDWVTIHKYNFNRRNENQNTYAWNALGLPYLEYRMVGSKIRFNRIPDNNTTIRLWYNPPATKLVDDTDVFDDINGYIEYVIDDCCIKMLAKQDLDAQVFMSQKEALKKRITEISDNRDANEPSSVTDIYAENSDWFFITQT